MQFRCYLKGRDKRRIRVILDAELDFVLAALVERAYAGAEKRVDAQHHPNLRRLMNEGCGWI
jgi:hypothetical protein